MVLQSIHHSSHMYNLVFVSESRVWIQPETNCWKGQRVKEFWKGPEVGEDESDGGWS